MATNRQGAGSLNAATAGEHSRCVDEGASPELISEPTEAGEQTLVPGVGAITLRQRLERRAEGPLLPRRLQKPVDFGLFDLAARNQLDLF